jgi:hypothetical protein
MKFRFTGPQDEITLQGVTFEKGKAVDVASPELVAKISVLPYFQKVKAARNDKAKK